MLFLSRLLAVLLLLEASSSMEFMIKHKKSESYIHPHNSDVAIPNGDELLIHSGYHNGMYMTFDIIDGQWGYIRHINSGKVFHPKSGSDVPKDNTKLVLHSDRKPWAYFALDQVNNHIVHHEGKYIHPHDGKPYPSDNTPCILHGDVHENMEFKLVSTSNPDEEVYPYGDATIVGDWHLVYSVENPLATHTETYQVTVGKSKSESTTESFQFVWESEARAQFYFAEMSTSASLSTEIQESSSETWHAEVTKTDSVTVVAGETVAVWQKSYTGEQLGHKSLHLSTMLTDTNSPHVKPDDYAQSRYRFI